MTEALSAMSDDDFKAHIEKLNAMSDEEFAAPFVEARTKQILEAIRVNRVGVLRLLEPELSALIDSRVAILLYPEADKHKRKGEGKMSETELKEAVLTVIRENPEVVIEALGEDLGKATRGTLRDVFAPLAAFGRGEPKQLGDFFKDMREVVVGLKSA